MKTKKKKKPSRSKLVHKLDSIFSQYIRIYNSDLKWMVQCYTCGDVKHYKEMQNWHFVSRGHYKYRWDENNCKPQCYKCNCILWWNYKTYTSRMIDEQWKGRIDMMIKDQQIVKISTPRIVEQIDFYTEIVEKLLWNIKAKA